MYDKFDGDLNAIQSIIDERSGFTMMFGILWRCTKFPQYDYRDINK